MHLAVSIVFAVTGSIVVWIALRVIFSSINPSSVTGYRPCKGGWSEAYLNDCESGLIKVPQQPVNTYTNIAYVAVGFFLIFHLNTLSAFVLAMASLYLCAGSALYHATSTRWAGSLDVSAMYALFSALTIYAASLLVRWADPLVALIMFIVGILCGYVLRYKFRGNVSLKIAIFLGLTYLLTGWSLIRNGHTLLDGYLITSLVLFVLAYVVWLVDRARVFPIKGWGHGFWHLFTAAAIGFLFFGMYLSQ